MKIAETADFQGFGIARKACALKGERWLFIGLRSKSIANVNKVGSDLIGLIITVKVCLRKW